MARELRPGRKEMGVREVFLRGTWRTIFLTYSFILAKLASSTDITKFQGCPGRTSAGNWANPKELRSEETFGSGGASIIGSGRFPVQPI